MFGVNSAMSKCWAKMHSPCGQGFSREHLISAGIFDQAKIFVQGFDWCPNEVHVGVSAIASKILCGRHNSILEKADRAGISAVVAIDESIDQGQNTTAEIEGLELERWLLKLAINLTFHGEDRLGVGMIGAEQGLPAPYLVDVVFGDRSFTDKMGMYVIFPGGEYQFRMGEIMVVPIKKDGEIGGVYFNLRGIHVFLSMFPGHAPPALGELGNFELPQHVVEPTPRYRPTSIKIPRTDGTVSEVTVGWAC